jgi:hypothetical protein
LIEATSPQPAYPPRTFAAIVAIRFGAGYALAVMLKAPSKSALAVLLGTSLFTGCGKNESPVASSPPVAADGNPGDRVSSPGPLAPAAAPPASSPGRPVQQAWAPSSDPKLARFAGYTAPKPAAWLDQPPQGAMRIAEYVVPGRDGHNAAQIVVFHFGKGEGGNVASNIKRWEEQFKPAGDGTPAKAKIERFEVAGMPVTLAELQGEWKQMFQPSYTPDQQFLGAIVEAPTGLVVLRFAGESATVQANREDFMTMLKGLRREGA